MKFEITVMAENGSGQMVLMDRCTLTANKTSDAARQYAELFAQLSQPACDRED